MNTKKIFQLLIALAILAGSFASTGAAFAASACGTSYTIVRGDTLRQIAAKCGTTVSALQRANVLPGNGDLIYPGQVLLMPGAVIYNHDATTTYIVARGDTLKSIAAAFGTTMNALVALNPDITNVNLIYEGQRILVSGNGGTTPPPPATGSTYTVQRGDTLKMIAARYNTTLDALIKVNPQIGNINLIYVGQVINLPDSISTYTVQRGDTLKLIAARFGTTIDNLLALNTTITNPNWIYVGQVLRIR